MEPYLRINFGADHPGRWNVSEIVMAISRQLKGRPAFEGCRLPPVRVLAHQLGVSKNTIHTAYEELKAQGLIESRNRKGLFVQTEQNFLDKIDDKVVPLTQMRSISNGAGTNNIRAAAINLSTVFIDPRLLPTKKLSDCFRSVLKTPGLTNFADPQGFSPLREKLAQRLNKRGIAAKAEHIIMTNGSQEALDLVCRSLKSKTIATENPAYSTGKALLEMNGLNIVGLPIRPFEGVQLQEWENLLKYRKPGLVYLTSSYQNPTGYSYSGEEMSKIIDWSIQYNFGILEDDWGSDMLSYSEFRPSLRALGGANVLYMNSFTKKLLPSLRIGYLLSNEENIQSLLYCKKISTVGVSSIIEAVLFEFLDRGYYDGHLKRVQQELDIRYKHCLDLLRTFMQSEVKWTAPGGGSCLWLELPKRISLGQLALALEKKKIIIHSSEHSFTDRPHLHGFKIGYAYLNKKEMQNAIEVLSATLQKL
ncbi:MAG: PLP-dependent aminotransferase family protein [Oligoflexia bacterium]|nr:PLP-dependent aminotransferase family protein [Oligoflexia bacterium]MBF0366027.1 PLP-dependent aminotransferase family protein [Oligoflexia bacterium]